MKRIVIRAAAIVTAFGCLQVGAAEGGSVAVGRDRLALMPLPKSALGTAALSLPLDQDSGVVSNADAARNADGPRVTAARLSRLGRITGYTLDYDDAAGRALVARHGLLQVQTGVDLYRSPAAAGAGLAFWRRDDADVRLAKAAGATVSLSSFPVGSLGSSGFGLSGVAKLKGKPPVYGVDIQFARGPLVASVSVSAADSRSRRAYVLSLAKQLDARISGVLHGRIKGPAVPLPGKAKAGPPPSGLDLSALALTPQDLGGGTIKQQGYRLDKDLTPLSEYQRVMTPGGSFVFLQEQVALFHSPTEAGFAYSGMAGALSSKQAAQFFDPSDHITRYEPKRVAVAGGDEVRAVRALVGIGGGTTVLEGIVVMRIGATTEFVIVASPTTNPLTDRAIRDLAALAARRARAGLHQ